MLVDDRLGPQLPLALRAPADQRLERYLRAPSGLLEQLQALASGDMVDALYLQGTGAAGKTHLLLGGCALATALGKQAAYLSLANVRGRLREAAEGLDGDLIALDDIDAIAGHRDDEVALFDLHNRLRDAGRSVLYAASMAPDALPLLLPDLRSRLAQCTRWTLPVLDDDARAELLRQRAAARGLDFDDAALDWMLRRCSRDLGTLTALFERLDRASLAAQRRLTVPFLRQVLGAD
ncbi:DnaA regulatory inactivator Hda [Thermomonas carbonis]|uniref:DnaA regulatory inactivator Hda n=1 Tax=Thermomonas carbonis TaxID=1463158 RepID=A0A7G9SUF1_9GAMM|nr:DnaA regulatory inactivator Hda [Thermomonas carbonis]QNN71476.1 DnaA regulatory inactivator Hda [Thermomonas carbonis]